MMLPFQKKALEEAKARWAKALAKNEKDKTASAYGALSFDGFYDRDSTSAHSFFVAKPADQNTPMPLVIDIHGGLWRDGSKETNRRFALYLASLGFDVFCPDFPQAADTDLIGMIKEILKAISYARDNAHRLSLSFDDVFLMGNSSGAQLALALSVIFLSPALRKEFGFAVPKVAFKALVLNHPVVFFDSIPTSDMEDFKDIKALRYCLFGKDKGSKKAFYNPEGYSSLISYGYPPVRIISSAGDPFQDQAKTLYALLMNGGAKVEGDFNGDVTLGHYYNVKDVDSLDATTTNNGIALFLEGHIDKSTIV